MSKSIPSRSTALFPASQFLPDAFSFKDYIPEAGAEHKNKNPVTPPTAEQVENRLRRQGKTLSDAEILHWLKSLESVDYATKNTQAAIVELANGAYVAGTKIEEAAFVSINPLQSAMAVAASAFGTQQVKKVWTLASGRDGQELPPDAFQPLSLAAIQTLAQFAQSLDIPVNIFNAKGEMDTVALKNTASTPPTFAKPVYKKI